MRAQFTRLVVPSSRFTLSDVRYPHGSNPMKFRQLGTGRKYNANGSRIIAGLPIFPARYLRYQKKDAVITTFCSHICSRPTSEARDRTHCQKYFPLHHQIKCKPIYNWATSFKIWTSCPGLKAGRPRYGQPAQRKASPRAQLPQEPVVLPSTVKSNSVKSSDCSLSTSRFLSALARRSLSSASRRSARPHVQSLQARRLRPVLG